MPRCGRDGNGIKITPRPDSQLDLGLGAGTQVSKIFTGDNWWNSRLNVTVTANDDLDVEGNHSGKIIAYTDIIDPVNTWPDCNYVAIEIKVYITDNDEPLPVNCERPKIYGVQDDSLNDSQFFTIDPETLITKSLGGLYVGYDIEALDIHPISNELYAASGDDPAIGYPNGYLYKVNPETG
ncbi:hypothetical protein [Candidatus Albibeggiatoa sp. nov. BB20]|uniref:hypothetical protein n=1 Tax=Candidatus Albibeggiatoa sp. nov. BB20 TaxID=3162723 RepID=UPI0033658AC7